MDAATLESICSRVSSGGTPSRKRAEYFTTDSTGHLWVKSKELLDGSIHETEERITDEGLNESAAKYFPANTVLVAMYGANVGQLGWLRRPATVNQAICGLVVDEKKADWRFVFYSLLQNRGDLTVQAQGAAQQNLNQDLIRQFSVTLPPLSVQRRIAGILSGYDELMENSERRIRILEEMARTFYREWFVDFRFPGHEKVKYVSSSLGEVPEGWEVKRLGDIAENFDRRRKPLSKMQRAEMQGEYPYYGAAKVFDYVNDFIFDGEYLLLAEDGSVITPERGPILQLVNERFWPNNHTHILRGKTPVSTHFLYLALSLVDISPYITGAAQPKITQENMNRIPFVCGPVGLHNEFDKFVSPLIYRMQLLQRQTINLRRTRDLLLPRLLSGQIVRTS